MIASELCKACISSLKLIASLHAASGGRKSLSYNVQVSDQLERFTLWMGNIGALHPPESPMSLESRLHEAKDVLAYVLELLDNLKDITAELLEIASGEREGQTATIVHPSGDEETQSEETELWKEIGACITRLFRVSSLIRQAAPTDVFTKALSRNRYWFNDQFDIAHVRHAYPKLATQELSWLREKLGRAITHRRQYLSYIQDHRDKLEQPPEEIGNPVATKSQAPTASQMGSANHPSTFVTKASSLVPGQITPSMLAVEEESDAEDDTKSYTTVTPSIDGEVDISATVRVPKLGELQSGSKKEVECPFCYRIKKFKKERAWRRHVFSDLRTYVCTFPNCDAPYFRERDEWFHHEMQNHRVSYTCPLCQSKNFQLKEKYLAHIHRRHPEMIIEGDEQPVLDIARKPLDQIPAQECPCCSDWLNRLKETAGISDTAPSSPDNILCVTPKVFKRHLALHLEQLASFAIPIKPTADDSVDSKAAIESENVSLGKASLPSAHASGYLRPPSAEGERQYTESTKRDSTIGDLTSPEQLEARSVARKLLMDLMQRELIKHAGDEEYGAQRVKLLLDKYKDIEITPDVMEAAAENKKSGRDIIELLLDRRGDEIHITEDVLMGVMVNESGRDILDFLFDRRGYEIQITHDMITVAMGNKSAPDIMELLLDRRGDEIFITPRILRAAIWGSRRVDMIRLLFDRRGDQIGITDEFLGQASLAGDDVLDFVLDKAGGKFRISESVIEEAAKTQYGRVHGMERLLDRKGDWVRITERALMAAARNMRSGVEMMKILLDRGGDQVRITRAILRAAAENRVTGSAIVEILLDRRLAKLADITEQFRIQGRWAEAEDMVRKFASGAEVEPGGEIHIQRGKTLYLDSEGKTILGDEGSSSAADVESNISDPPAARIEASEEELGEFESVTITRGGSSGVVVRTDVEQQRGIARPSLHISQGAKGAKEQVGSGQEGQSTTTAATTATTTMDGMSTATNLETSESTGKKPMYTWEDVWTCCNCGKGTFSAWTDECNGCAHRACKTCPREVLKAPDRDSM